MSSFGAREYGDNAPKPGDCEVEAVVTDTGSVAVVAIDEASVLLDPSGRNIGADVRFALSVLPFTDPA